MQTSSQLIHHNQAIIPHLVLEALKLREGVTRHLERMGIRCG